MSFWEYKVISSGKGGFATPALLEKFLNDLGRDSWEIIEFRSAPDNALAFSGLARRSTQRDWTLEDAAAAAAKAEAEKLRAEFEAKFKAATSGGGGAGGEERAPSFLEEKVAPDDGFRKPVDTSHDDEPEPADDEKDDWDKLTAAEEDDLPTFFDAIKPHMRRNQRGPGMSVGVDYLAKKWDQSEDDLKGALVECGFVVPEDEDAAVEYLEYDGDLYWLNVNRRGELWINTKEKPRPVFKAVKAQRVAVEEEPKQENQNQNQNRQRDRERDRDKRNPKPAEGAAPAPEGAPAGEAGAAPAGEAAGQEGKGQSPTPNGGPLPQGPELLQKIRPHMRRNRRGPGGSGSTSFLSRALRTNEAELKSAFAALGLTIPGGANDKPVYTEVGNELWWLNLDSRGGLWINGREKRAGETAAGAREEGDAPAEAPAATGDAILAGETAAPRQIVENSAPAMAGEAPSPTGTEQPAESSTRSPFGEPSEPGTRSPFAEPASAPAPAAGDSAALAPIRALLKETKTGAVAGKLDRLAEELGQTPEAVTATLVGAGLKVPEKSREKPVFVTYGSEILWFNLNAKGELWLNAKESKFADKKEGAEGDEGEKKPRRPRSRSKKADDATETPAE